MHEMITAIEETAHVWLHVVSSLGEKQKGHVIVSLVEYLPKQVSWSADRLEKKDKQKSVPLFLLNT